jgi:S-adenosylmethionine:tRNA ribosyltransferase-isomerase
MHISDFDYELPDELIAQQPLAERTASRMLIVNRPSNEITDSRFSDLPEFIRPGDTLVLNNTKVFPARLNGRSETGARVEVFLVRNLGSSGWEVLARPARRLPVGKKIYFSEELQAVVTGRAEEGRLFVKFTASEDLDSIFDKIGRTPLPPYIKRGSKQPDTDRERYQTVFAKERGAIAAPTAGLHFTPEILDKIRRSGAEVCEVTLHVGYGTFEPVRVDDLSKHTVLPEEYEVTAATAAILNKTLEEKRRIIAVGTTTTRTLETSIRKHGQFAAERAMANLTITPGYEFKAVDGMLTNFHLPKSSLLVLVSTFAGHELTMRAYRHAVRERYRFYSYGDCMLVF